MARHSNLSIDSLQALGAAKLASLVFDEAASNLAFKRRVAASLAGQGGPVALAKVLYKRLAGLERARSVVDWDKARGFRDYLAALFAGILQDLAPLNPAMAMERLIRFIATHEVVFDRVDDSGVHVQAVYGDAIDAVEPLAARLDAKTTAALPGQIMDRLGESEHGYLPRVAAATPSAGLGRGSCRQDHGARRGRGASARLWPMVSFDDRPMARDPSAPGPRAEQPRSLP